VVVALDALPVPALVVDVAGDLPVVVAANGPLAHVLGLPSDVVAGRPVGTVVVGGLVGESGLLSALLAGVAADAPAFLAAPAGSMVRVRAAVAAAPVGTSERLVTFTVDADADAGLRPWIEDLVSSLPVAVAVSRVGAQVAFVNDRFAGLCRLPASKLVGTGWLSVVREEHRDRLLDAVTAALEGQEHVVELALVSGVEVNAIFRPAERPLGPAGFVVVFDVRSGATIEAAIDEAEMAGDLAADLAAGTVGVAYQPVMDADGGCAAMEALVRWVHRKRGPIAASVVSELAERQDLLEPLLDHVLRTALRDHARMRDVLGDVAPGYVAVNVSPSQLHERTVDSIIEAMDAQGVTGDRLCVELIETAAVTDPTGAAAALAPLAARNVRVALDDFGTGFSSISMLRELPVTIVKVDRLFVEHVTTSSVDRHLVGGVVRIALDLGADVVAEGVETPEQEAVVRELGCRYTQGWLHGKAMTADDLIALITERSGHGSVAETTDGAARRETSEGNEGG
jgi:EAL domain-containing protein (putative c-di-GMP-specific phosphodiesterase class I)/PAS domain-containing protein